MNNSFSVNPSKSTVKAIVLSIVGILVFIVAIALVIPWYNVWSQEMEGKAEFAKAEQNRKIKIEEAKANLEA